MSGKISRGNGITMKITFIRATGNPLGKPDENNNEYTIYPGTENSLGKPDAKAAADGDLQLAKQKK